MKSNFVKLIDWEIVLWGLVGLICLIILFFIFKSDQDKCKSQIQYIPAECIDTDIHFCVTNSDGIVIGGTIHFPATGGIVYPDMTNTK